MQLRTVYHKDIGIPAGLAMPAPGTGLHYTTHARNRVGQRVHQTLLPARLPSVFEVVEVSVFAGQAAQWVVRFPLMQNQQGKATRTDYDLVLVVGTGIQNPLAVLTVYLNHKDDTHATLDRDAYAASASGALGR